MNARPDHVRLGDTAKEECLFSGPIPHDDGPDVEEARNRSLIDRQVGKIVYPQ
jgi:hypothetical protein